MLAPGGRPLPQGHLPVCAGRLPVRGLRGGGCRPVHGAMQAVPWCCIAGRGVWATTTGRAHPADAQFCRRLLRCSPGLHWCNPPSHTTQAILPRPQVLLWRWHRDRAQLQRHRGDWLHQRLLLLPAPVCPSSVSWGGRQGFRAPWAGTARRARPTGTAGVARSRGPPAPCLPQYHPSGIPLPAPRRPQTHVRLPAASWGCNCGR